MHSLVDMVLLFLIGIISLIFYVAIPRLGVELLAANITLNTHIFKSPCPQLMYTNHQQHQRQRP